MKDRKFCLLAGAGPGVGMGIARRFAQEGFRVGLVARRPEALDDYVREVEAAGGAGLAIPADLTDFAATRAALDAALAEHGPADVLVYNASVWRGEGVLEVDPADFHRDLALDVTGAVVAVQAVAPGMAEAGGGVILLTGGGLALRPQDGAPAPSLTAGKSALRGLAFAMAGELAPRGLPVRTVTIAGNVEPGTPFDPARIAEAMWARYAAPADDAAVETIFRGG